MNMKLNMLKAVPLRELSPGDVFAWANGEDVRPHMVLKKEPVLMQPLLLEAGAVPIVALEDGSLGWERTSTQVTLLSGSFIQEGFRE